MFQTALQYRNQFWLSFFLQNNQFYLPHFAVTTSLTVSILYFQFSICVSSIFLFSACLNSVVPVLCLHYFNIFSFLPPLNVYSQCSAHFDSVFPVFWLPHFNITSFLSVALSGRFYLPYQMQHVVYHVMSQSLTINNLKSCDIQHIFIRNVSLLICVNCFC